MDPNHRREAPVGLAPFQGFQPLPIPPHQLVDPHQPLDPLPPFPLQLNGPLPLFPVLEPNQILRLPRQRREIPDLPPLYPDDIIQNPDLAPVYPPVINDNVPFFNIQDQDEINILDMELGKMNVPLDRMLTWADIDGYYLHKFRTGRSFKNRGYYDSLVQDFYARIFYAYPEDLRAGLVEYNPNIHEVQTMLYEEQLRCLEQLSEEERMGLH